MQWRDLLIDGFGRPLEILEPALRGLTPEEMNAQPKSDCNSIGWTIWHLSRVQDSQIADLMDGKQVWVRDKWHVRFKRAAKAEDTGYGDKDEDVAAFRSPDAETQLGYYRAVYEQTKQYLRGLKAAELERELNEPWFKPLPTVGVRIVSIMADCLEHAGEVAYIRGLLKGKGWMD